MSDESKENVDTNIAAPDAPETEKTAAEKIYSEETKLERKIIGSENIEKPAEEVTEDTPEDTPEEKKEDTPEGEKEDSTEEKKEDTKPDEVSLKKTEESILTDSQVDEIAEFSKKHGLSQDQAESVMNRENNLRLSMTEASKNVFHEMADQWVGELKKDTEVGGESLQESAETGKRFLRRFFDQEVIDTLNTTGLGNHPGLFRGFVRAGRVMAEDKLVNGSIEPVRKQKSLAERIYPSKTT